jgi:7,8-dihydropterin-6-yl-methyl-4-(beta-D-ribofuranosyl)aminobenzene 5'-phosphate synthase
MTYMIQKITVLCENTVLSTAPLIGEHGLSFLIEDGDDVTLFDTGQGLGIINNMKKMRKDIKSIKRIILSHGHYDHTGGLMPVLREYGGSIPVYLNVSAFNEKSAIQPDGGMAPIGMRYSRDEYEKNGAVFHEISDLAAITDSITSLSGIKHGSNWHSWDTRLKQRSGSDMMDDPFEDDLSLLLETPKGPVALLGCAHAGIIEILAEFSRRMGIKKFHAVIGGTHLGNAPENYVVKAINAVRDYDVDIIGVSHCTGFKVAMRFANEFPDRFANASVGSVFEFRKAG